jgi:hypothetical protein
MKRAAFAFLLLLGACGTPGKYVTPEPGDFAFLDVKLKG